MKLVEMETGESSKGGKSGMKFKTAKTWPKE